MKILTMGSPATTYIFNQKVNEIYNGDYEVKKIREFYTIGHLLSDYSSVKLFADTLKTNEELYEFLKWNFEKGGFWGKIKEYQPDLLILDLFSEVFFGSYLLGHGNMVTRNIRLMKEVPDPTKIFNISTPNYVERVIEQITQLEQKIKDISPNTKLIFNGAKFPENMSKDGILQSAYDNKIYKLSIKKIKNYNKYWSALDKKLLEAGYDVLRFDKKNNAAELNFPTGSNWYYLYNQNYYTDVQSQIEEIAQKYDLGPTIITLNIEKDKYIDFSNIFQDVVFLNVPNSRNDLLIFRKNKVARKMALDLAAKDYILHGNKGHQYRFVKRKKLKTKFPKFKDIHYRIIPPNDKNKYWDNRLLVRMFGFSLPFKTSVIDRNFRLDFLTLKDSIVKNTFILEIGDINLIAGSFYSNTNNFPDYENQIQELISVISKKYEVKRDNVVIYGTSRGATGAILHGSLGNYKFIAADPVIDDTSWYKKSDLHFVSGVRNVDLTSRIYESLDNYNRSRDDGILLASSNVGVTFSAHLRLPLCKFKLIDLNMNIFEHSLINQKSVPIQLSYINDLLIRNTIRLINDPQDIKHGVVLERKDLISKSINFEKIDRFRLRKEKEENDFDFTHETEERLDYSPFKHIGVDEEFEYFKK